MLTTHAQCSFCTHSAENPFVVLKYSILSVLVFGFLFPMVKFLRPFAVACAFRRLFAVAFSKGLLNLAAGFPDVCVKFCDCHGFENMGRLLAAPVLFIVSVLKWWDGSSIL